MKVCGYMVVPAEKGKHMKKVVKRRLFIILCLMITSIISIPILASSLPAKNELTIAVSDKKGVAGNTVEVPLQILGNDKQGIWGIYLIVYYNENVMTPVSYSNGGIFPDNGWKTKDASGEYRILCWNEDRKENIETNGIFGTITFEINENAVSSKEELLVNVVQAIKADGKDPNGIWAEGTQTELSKRDKILTPVINGNLQVFNPKTYIPAWKSTTVTADKVEAVYDKGNPVITLQSPEVVEKEDVKYSYQWYKDEEKLENQTGKTLSLCNAADSGIYKVEITTSLIDYTEKAFSSEIPVVIEKATPNVTGTKGTNITYGDVLGKSKFDKFHADTEGTFAWVDGTEKPQISDSGTTNYAYQFIPTDSSNYKTVSGMTTVTVDKKELIPGLNTVDNIIYNGATATNGTITLSGAVNGEMPTAEAVFDFVDKTAGINKNITVTEIALDSAWEDRYVLSTTELQQVATTAEILKKEVGLEWVGYENLVYQNTPVSVGAMATDLVRGDTCAVLVQGGNQINAGMYIASAISLSNPNYKLPGETEKEYEIQKADTSVMVSVRKMEPPILKEILAGFMFADYKDKIELTATVLGVPGANPNGKINFYDNGNLIAENITLTDGQAVYIMEAPLTAAGEHQITAVYTSEDLNYFGSETDGAFAFDVDKANQDALTISTKSDYTYGDGIFALETSGGEGVGAITFESSNPDVISIDGNTATICNVGTCFITAKKAGDDNYLETSVNREFTVAKKELVPSLDMVEDIIYNKTTATTGTITLSGAVNEEEPIGTAVFNFVTADAGTNKKVHITEIMLEPEWEASYVLSTTELNDVETTAKIDKAKVTFALINNKFVSNGEIQHAVVNSMAEGFRLSEEDYSIIYLKDKKKAEPVEPGTYTVQIKLNNDSIVFEQKEDVRILEIGQLVIEGNKSMPVPTGDSQLIVPVIILLCICGITILAVLKKKKYKTC